MSLFMLLAAASGTPDLQAVIDCSRDQGARASFDREHFDSIAREAEQHCSKLFSGAIDQSIHLLTKGDSSQLQIGKDNIAAKFRIAANDQVIRRLEGGEQFPVPAVGTLPTTVTVAYKAYLECFLVSNLRVADRFYEGDMEFEAITRSSSIEASKKMLSISQTACPQSRARLEQTYSAHLSTERIKEKAKAPYISKLMGGLEQMAADRLLRSLGKTND